MAGAMKLEPAIGARIVTEGLLFAAVPTVVDWLPGLVTVGAPA